DDDLQQDPKLPALSSKPPASAGASAKEDVINYDLERVMSIIEQAKLSEPPEKVAKMSLGELYNRTKNNPTLKELYDTYGHDIMKAFEDPRPFPENQNKLFLGIYRLMADAATKQLAATEETKALKD